MELHYCWRCTRVMPFLDEREWAQVAPLLKATLPEVMEKGKAHPDHGKAGVELFASLTGFSGIPRWDIYHHRRSDWGEQCPSCNQLLRTPKANFCASCGQLTR